MTVRENNCIHRDGWGYTSTSSSWTFFFPIFTLVPYKNNHLLSNSSDRLWDLTLPVWHSEKQSHWGDFYITGLPRMESGKRGWVQAHLFDVFAEDWMPKEHSKSCLAAVTWWHCNTSQLGFLHWAKIQGIAGKILRWTMGRKPHSSHSNQLCANTADLVVGWDLLVITASQHGCISSSLSLCRAMQVCGCMVCTQRESMEQQISGLYKTSSWAVIPVVVVLLTTLGGLVQTYWLVSELTYLGERKGFHGGSVCSTQFTFLLHILRYHTPDRSWRKKGLKFDLCSFTVTLD